jgi:FAD/FMN-containing dehydrogenase
LNTTDIISSYESAHYVGPAAKLGAGAISGNVYQQVGAAGYRIMGGTCPTVGLAGGYTSGAGHSLLNGAYGMAADAVLEWEVITTKGEHIIATPSNHTDLYWALSGGGAGTFGVVLSMTTKIFPDGPIGSGILTFNMSSNNTENYWEAIEDLWTFLPQFVDAGPNTWDFALTPTGFQAYAITVPNKNGTQVQNLLQPWLESLTAHGINYSYLPTTSANYLAYFTSRFGPGVAGAGPATVQLASRLIPRAGVLDHDQNQLIVKALRDFVEHEYWSIGCHALNVKDIEHPDNAVLPGWRDAIATCNIVSYWDWNATQSEMQARKELLVDTLIPALEEATPGAGTYMNEIDAQWKGDWKTELYGVNYPRLLDIKNKYDPDHVLYAWTAVGSDSWMRDSSGRLCRS